MGILETQVVETLAATLVQHISQLTHTFRTLQGATFVINVESNLAYVAESIEHYMQRQRALLPTVHVLRNDLRRQRGGGGGGGGGATDMDPLYTAGTRTTQRNKKEMVMIFDSMLRGGLVRFARHLFALEGAEMAQQWRQDIVKELGNFKRELVYPKQRGQRVPRVRETFSGKYGRNSDDWVMTLLIASFTFDMIQRTDRFQHLRH